MTDLFSEYRQQEDELQAEKNQWQSEWNRIILEIQKFKDKFTQKIEKLKKGNDCLQKLHSLNLTKSLQTQTEALKTVTTLLAGCWCRVKREADKRASTAHTPSGIVYFYNIDSD